MVGIRKFSFVVAEKQTINLAFQIIKFRLNEYNVRFYLYTL